MKQAGGRRLARERPVCGPGGCRYTGYLTHGQNLVRIFDRQVMAGLTFSMADGKPRFEGSFHHGSCGDRCDDCRLAWGLDATTRKLVARASANGDTFASQNQVRPFDDLWTGED